MTPPEEQHNIGLDLLTDVYRQTTVETRDPQPIYFLQRDTIRTFLHEKIGLFGQQARTVGLLGVEVSLLATLATASFHDFWVVPADVVHAAFVLACLAIGVGLVVNVVRWLTERGDRSVDALSNQLGARGSEIRPKPISAFSIQA